jgi:CRISPR-associated protein Csx3
MKIILAGPPKSGKSTLREGLKQAIMRFPNAPYPYVITACPDGEGAWFQETARRSPGDAKQLKTEYKNRLGGFSPAQVEKFATWVRECTLPLTLVDIGGIASEENWQICRHATHAIILFTSPQNLREWQQFCRDLGLTVIAEIFSDYHGKEDVVEEIDDVLKGSIHHLERGEDCSQRPMVMKLAQRTC